MKRSIKALVKQIASPVLDATGLLDRQIAQLCDVPGRLLVVMYHRVIAEASSDPFELGMCVRKEVFAEQLDYFQSRFNVLSLSEAVARNERGETLPPASLAITFDDGYLDNLEVAAPMLKARGLPATFFVATGGLCKGEALWWDRAIAAFTETILTEIDLPMLGFGSRLSLMPGERAETVEAVLAALWALPPSHLAPTLDTVINMLVPGEDYRSARRVHAPRMSARQVSCLQQMGFEIGAHTDRHVDMRNLNYSERQSELVPARALLRTMLDKPSVGFAYPSGFHDNSLRLAVRDAGYEYAVSTDRGINHGRLRRFALYRVGMPDTSLANFKRALCTVPLPGKELAEASEVNS